jgi:Ser-tRNA(Ala) deacylase AlaX
MLAPPPYTLPDQARNLADAVRNVGQHLPQKAPAVRLEQIGEQIERLAEAMESQTQGETMNIKPQARAALDRLHTALERIEEVLTYLHNAEEDEAHSKLTWASDDIEAATRTLKLLIETSSE